MAHFWGYRHLRRLRPPSLRRQAETSLQGVLQPVGAGLGRSCKYVRPPPRSPRDKYAALRNPHDKVDRLYAGHRSGALGRHLYGNGLPASLCPKSAKLRVNILLTNQLPHRGLGQTAKVKWSPFTKGVITVPRFGKECVQQCGQGVETEA